MLFDNEAAFPLRAPNTALAGEEEAEGAISENRAWGRDFAGAVGDASSGFVATTIKASASASTLSQAWSAYLWL